ncbi:MAG: hypothetical protein IPL53_09445 [Ignavibacteria bacterium]|nr:hypothetical protein [Ignavibacteria bacterium]
MRTFANMISLRAESKAATEEFNSSRENTINLIRRLSNQIKSSKKYDTGIGADFGIINRYSPVTDFSRHKPELKAKLNGSEVIIRYQAYGTDGLTLYSKRGNETKFTKLSIVFGRTYTDNRPNLSRSIPEAREYYAYYYVKDGETGLRSDVVKLVVP